MVELFKGIKVDWLGKRKLFFAISIGLLLIGMASLVAKGTFRYGLDFKGGTLVRVRFPNVVDISAVRNLLPDANIQSIRTTETHECATLGNRKIFWRRCFKRSGQVSDDWHLVRHVAMSYLFTLLDA